VLDGTVSARCGAGADSATAGHDVVSLSLSAVNLIVE
jgi:hypothetical protein